MAGDGVSKNIWNCFRTAPVGTGQPLTCSTSGMGLRLKWISIEMCRVLSLSMCSWTTISLIRRFRVAASSSVMSAYSWMASTHCLASIASRISSASFLRPCATRSFNSACSFCVLSSMRLKLASLIRPATMSS